MIMYFGVRIDEDINITDKKDIVSLEQRVYYKLFDTEKERNYFVASRKNCLIFDITEDIIDLYGFKDKNDVYEMLKKGYKQSQEKLKNSLNRTIWKIKEWIKWKIKDFVI